MQVNSDNPKEHKTITPTKMLITAGILCIPVITETGEVLNKTIKTHRLEKTPLKDSFIKVVEQNGKKSAYICNIINHCIGPYGFINFKIIKNPVFKQNHCT